ncbi:MAG TPA: BON domain-containing protein [Blastocatellia bacterium]|nr:BON domain-containing protein [Blastocatellia bacterium]
MASRYGYGRSGRRYEAEEDRYGRRDRWGDDDRGREERGFWDRARDEVRSWGGDEEAERRRRTDEREGYHRRYGREGYGGHPERQVYGRAGGYDREEERSFGRAPESESWPESGYGQGYYGGFGRGGHYFGTSENPDDRTYTATGYDSDFSPFEYTGGYRDRWESSGSGRGGGYSEGRRQRGPYSGRGPRGYQRSDERIREDVNERLTRHGDIDATDIEVAVNNGEVTLSGTVDDRRTRRLAEDVAENVTGVTNVINRLRVGQGSQV